MSKVTDVEVSAFSECFLLTLYSLKYKEPYKSNQQYKHKIYNNWKIKSHLSQWIINENKIKQMNKILSLIIFLIWYFETKSTYAYVFSSKYQTSENVTKSSNRKPSNWLEYKEYRFCLFVSRILQVYYAPSFSSSSPLQVIKKLHTVLNIML